MKRKKDIFKFDQLVECTAKFFLENNISIDQTNIPQALGGIHYDGSGLIGEIIKRVYGSFELSAAYSIRNWFNRNDYDFKVI